MFCHKFQISGSEHDHDHLWVKDASIYGINTNEKIENFVDKHISCCVIIANYITKCIITSTHSNM